PQSRRAFLADRAMFVLHGSRRPVRWGQSAVGGEVLGAGETGPVAEPATNRRRGDRAGPRHREQQIIGAVEGVPEPVELLGVAVESVRGLIDVGEHSSYFQPPEIEVIVVLED